MQATFNGAFTDGTFEQAAFKMNQLRLEARGDINDWLSYRWRQRLNSSNTPHALDNLPSSIDYAMISVRLTDQVRHLHRETGGSIRWFRIRFGSD